LNELERIGPQHLQTPRKVNDMKTSQPVVQAPPRVTIFEVARRAGVSSGTVSRAINNRYGISETTRRRVLQVVEETGYVPDLSARQLARGQRSVIGITRFSDHSLRNPYYIHLIDAIQEALLDAGYAVRILEHDTIPNDVAGVIVAGVRSHDARPETFRAKGVPLVVIGQMPEGFSWVEVNNVQGMRDLVQHLIALGHRRIAHMTGTPMGQTANTRIHAHQGVLEAHRAALARVGQSLEDDLILDGRFSELGGYLAMKQALVEGFNATAIACASDEMALGAMQAILEHGWRIPQDISVTGFDDLALVSPVRLTTVRQPIYRVGTTAAQFLLEVLAGQSAQSRLLPVKLMVRDSSGTIGQPA
jgi:LacI family transcriptional regulator